MALLKHDHPKPVDTWDWFFDRWPAMWWTKEYGDMLRVDEFQDNGTWVLKAELAGVDPDKDVEITVSDGVLHIRAERRAEEKTEGKDFYRQELRYGTFTRDLVLPEGCSAEQIDASYHDGLLEVRVPTPVVPTTKDTTKVAISKT